MAKQLLFIAVVICDDLKPIASRGCAFSEFFSRNFLKILFNVILRPFSIRYSPSCSDWVSESFAKLRIFFESNKENAKEK